MDTGPLIFANAKRWSTALVMPSKVSAFSQVAQRLCASSARSKYADIQRATGVPWWIIAVIHERESGQNWACSIAQGDSWNRVSTHVPAGRGPFGSFSEAAVDALNNCPPYAAKWKDWSPGGALTLLEQYNGLGYARKGLPSPYIWAGTDQYSKGKYVSDGHFDPNAVDQQLGCAGLIKAMMKLDATVLAYQPTPAPPLVAPAPKPAPVPHTPSFWARVISAIFSAFRGKQ